MDRTQLLEEIRSFLVEANEAGYAAGESAKITKEADGSKTIVYERDDWRYHDNYFGGEPYGGREVVFFENKPVWMMVYYGWVAKGVPDPSAVYAPLQAALRAMPADHPFRGPEKHESGGFSYSNKWVGEVDRFEGEECICQGEILVYQAGYMGGLVDQR